MKVCLVHNHYQQPGGEDQVFAAEGRLLEDGGHELIRYTVSNDGVDGAGRLALARSTVWNSARYRELRHLFQTGRPDVVHVHNTLPLISPAVYYAAKAEGAAVVQTLHNYRLSCVNGLFFRDGRVCEDCVGSFVPWAGVARGCYRESRAASGVVAGMLGFHKLRNTYHETVDLYVALTDFARRKFVEAGLPAAKIVVKPNFLEVDPGLGSGRGGYALFVGRLSREKGLDTLLAAWQQFGGRLPLKVVGDGPLANQVAGSRVKGVEWLGRQPRERVIKLLQGSALLVFPSVWYEGFPLTLIEAFAVGLPVVASRLGSMASIVEHERTGLHFEPGDASDLVAQIEWALSRPTALAQIRREARAEYESKYTAESNYGMLLDIYERAISGGR